MNKPKRNECNDVIAEQTKLIEKVFVESPGQTAKVSNKGSVKSKTREIKVTGPKKTMHEEFHLAIRPTGSLELNRYTAAFIAALATCGQITMSKTGMVKRAREMTEDVGVKRDDLRKYASAIDTGSGFIEVQQIGRNRRFSLCDLGKKLVKHAKQQEVQHLSALLREYEERQLEVDWDEVVEIWDETDLKMAA